MRRNAGLEAKIKPLVFLLSHPSCWWGAAGGRGLWMIANQTLKPTLVELLHLLLHGCGGVDGRTGRSLVLK